ncbi:MAG: TM0996/MTH895 family glutaredoxin-like protein [Chloroflexi bacterium]|uniref:TM0996/MTH895 family glutaredoxin-like protein n=1 Tax=Candidatus Chlorohelix allophototropha TaxID=3003348 RepID=A0A8T7M4G1_9CHLR|nr:TM0996/MTH895 family glutaredoxin-like protein [Chloroflexota bacterium]WJW70035.1 thioredoxin family protein [Chloroflexota bacterium L227-S17]
MLNVKVLGSGCANCKKLEGLVRKVVDEQGLVAEVEKVTDYAEIMKWNVMSTPGLVVNDKVVSTGRIPKESEVKAWLNS